MTAARAAALVAASALLSGFTILRGYGPHDEGLMLAWAARVSHGEWPYRDFWSNYAPGQTVVLGALWKAFGPSLLAWRVLRVAIDATVALLAYALVRREGAREPVALLAWLAVAGAMAWPTGPGPNAPALALALGTLLVAPHRRTGEDALTVNAPLAAPGAGTGAWRSVGRALSRSRGTRRGARTMLRRAPGRTLLAGALAGLAVAFRPEIGVAAVLGLWWQARSMRPVLVAAGVAVVALLPFFAVAPGDMADQVVGFLGIQHLQRLPFPLAPHTTDPNKVFERLFPAILVVSSAVWVVWAAARRALHPALPLAVVGLAYLAGRADEFHWVPLSVALAILLGCAAARESGCLRIPLLVALALIALNGVERRGGQLLHPPALAAVPGRAGDGVQTDPADARALRGLVRAVDRAAPPGAPVFVADPRHDLVRVGDAALYAILDRRNPTRYDVMQPGVVTTAKVQREIVADLERTHALVVRWLDPTASQPEPNGAGRSSGVGVLDDYLAARYAPRARFGPYELLEVR